MQENLVEEEEKGCLGWGKFGRSEMEGEGEEEEGEVSGEDRSSRKKKKAGTPNKRGKKKPNHQTVHSESKKRTDKEKKYFNAGYLPSNSGVLCSPPLLC